MSHLPGPSCRCDFPAVGDAALPLHHNQVFPPKEGVGVEVYLRAGRERRMPHLWELLGPGGAAEGGAAGRGL